MAHIFEVRVLETTTTTGTGVLSLAGVVTGFKTFASVCAVTDTLWYYIEAVDGSGVPTGEYESGLGTYSAANQLTRTTVLRSSNANAAVNFTAGTKRVGLTLVSNRVLELDAGLTVPMPTIITEPAAPADGTLLLYARKVAQRHMLKTIGPSGVDSVLQTALFQNRILIYVPDTGTVGTGNGRGLGPVWTSGGTVNHPTPASTAPAISNQMRRTRYANVVTTTNQTLGIKAAAADTVNYWRGNAAGLGGFFYAARFIVELYPAATVRIFAGMAGGFATYVVAADVVINDTCGLWHDTTDPSTGSGAFNFVTRDATTTTKQPIVLANAIAAGNTYDFYMFCPPNGATLYWRLADIVNNVTYEGNTATTLPRNTIFLGPQCAMSNGTANITVTTTAMGIAGVYTESDR